MGEPGTQLLAALDMDHCVVCMHRLGWPASSIPPELEDAVIKGCSLSKVTPGARCAQDLDTIGVSRG